jgi:hypothetical protein
MSEQNSLEPEPTPPKFYNGDRLLTVTEMCDALRTWSRLAADYLEKNYGLTPHLVQSAFLAVDKSALLGRMLYGQEKPRTEPCPECKGVWRGCFLNCPCGGCGWLPKEKP